MNRPEPQDAQRGEVGTIEEGESTELVVIPSDHMVDSQISTAKRYPRSVTKFLREVKSLATLDEETAASCMYALPRGGKTIEGPSARFAEILLYSWGNSRAEARVIAEGPTHIECEGTFYDLERNVAVRKVIKRRITNKQGRRYDDDMIGTTGNAGNSIAFRNAVFTAIPKALWKGIYEQTRLASLGKAGTLTQTRQKMIDYFGKMGILPEKLFAILDVEGLEDVREDQIITMRGLATALKDGETTVEDLLNPRNTGTAGSGTPDLNERLAKKGANGGAKTERGDAAEPENG